MQGSYYSFHNYLKERFGARVHRISLNAGFACPNRDGGIGREGCIFCNEEGFAAFPDSRMPLERQIEKSQEALRRRFKAQKFIAYFQNATNTCAPLDELKRAYDTIRRFPDIVGLFISTRPDCVDEERLDLIEGYAKNYEVWIEYGLQTIRDATLARLKRGHTYEQFLQAVNATSRRDIKTGVHVILGLPGEDREDMIETAKALSGLPVAGIKLHVLHVLRGTELEAMHARGAIKLLTEAEYVGLACDFLECTRPDRVILRLVSDARPDALIAPAWINEKQKVIRDIENEFQRRGTRQGSKSERCRQYSGRNG